MPPYSVFSEGRTGMATAGSVLSRLGFEPVALTRPIQNTRFRGLLLVIEPQGTAGFMNAAKVFGEYDSQGLLRWVREGNTLVLATGVETELHTILEVSVDAQEDDEDKENRFLGEAMEIGGYTEPVEGGNTMPIRDVVVETKTSLRGGKAIPLWLVGGKPGALLVPHGKGRVIFIADPSIWTHQGLVEHDNVLLLYNLAVLDGVQGRVYFDEYHHGIRSASSYLDYFRYHGVQWILLQLVLIGTLAVWGLAVRLGPALPLGAKPHADAVDYASAVARIHERAGLLRQMGRHLARDFRNGITRLLHLRKNAGNEEILAIWRKRRGPQSGSELSELIQVAEEMKLDSTPGMPKNKRELLHWSKEFDRFLKLSDKGK